MNLRFGRRRTSLAWPLSGRYLTRLIVLTLGCGAAMVALGLPRWRAKANPPPTDAAAPFVQTALAPSPYGELGMGVIVADGRPKPPQEPPDDAIAPPDSSNELPRVDVRLLANVLDKTKELYKRPYYHLVTIAAEARPDLLEQGARRDLTYVDLWNEPDKYRGQLIYLQGYLRGLVPIEPTDDEYFNPLQLKTLYQGHLITAESHPNSYVIVVPGVPAGIPMGKNIAENVTFAGHFFKLWQYSAADNTERAAPLVIGRMLTWTPAPPNNRYAHLSAYLAAGFVLIIIGVGGAMWALNRRSAASAATTGESPAQATLSELKELENLDVPNPVNELENEHGT